MGSGNQGRDGDNPILLLLSADRRLNVCGVAVFVENAYKREDDSQGG